MSEIAYEARRPPSEEGSKASPPPSGLTYVSLCVDVESAYRSWLVDVLAEGGFECFEEREVAEGARLIVYASGRGAKEQLSRLRRAIDERYRQFGAKPLRFDLAVVQSGWQTKWTEHLQAVQLTATLRVEPRAAGPDREPGVLYLEPAFAFGYGEHPSTRLLAKWVERECQTARGLTVLDVGTGTGILSLVAVAGGARSVVGLDTSLEALAVARRNATAHGCDERLEFRPGSVEPDTGRFDRVVCNLEATGQLELAPALCRTLAPGGRIALSGFVAHQVPELIDRYRRCGLCVEVAGAEGEWELLAGQPGQSHL